MRHSVIRNLNALAITLMNERVKYKDYEGERYAKLRVILGDTIKQIGELVKEEVNDDENSESR